MKRKAEITREILKVPFLISCPRTKKKQYYFLVFSVQINTALLIDGRHICEPKRKRKAGITRETLKVPFLINSLGPRL